VPFGSRARLGPKFRKTTINDTAAMPSVIIELDTRRLGRRSASDQRAALLTLPSARQLSGNAR
jgi:hypothetical protein